MKGKKVGKNVELLWPNLATMSDLILPNPSTSHSENLSPSPEHNPAASNNILYPDNSASDLLWPARLINEQARLVHRKSLSRPIAIAALILSIALGFILGPLQIICVAMFLNYDETSIIFSEVTYYCLITSGIVGIICTLAAIIAFRDRLKTAALNLAIIIGTLAELTLIWLSSAILPLEMHEYTIVYLIVTALIILIILFLSKQYFKTPQLSIPIKIALGATAILSIIITSFTGVYLAKHTEQTSPDRINQLAAAQLDSRLDGVPEILSDLTYALCTGRYSIVFLSSTEPSGLFECANNGDVYSVTDLNEHDARIIRAASTYLGTTRDTNINKAFPEAKYLYRSLPGITTEAELALMVAASSEEELIDFITPQIIEYWNANSTQPLHLSVFYANELDSISTTKDFILMSALETMVLADKLPSGNTRQGTFNGKLINYLYRPDQNLIALSELGTNPSLYSASARDAFTMHRHISIHLTAEESLDEESFRLQLLESFTGGLE